MPNLTVWRNQLPKPPFPALCMRCGRRSTLIVPHLFVDYSDKTRMNREMIPVPLCDRHRNMWHIRTFLFGLAAGGPVLCTLVSLGVGKEFLTNEMVQHPVVQGLRIAAGCMIVPLLLFALFVTLTWRRLVIHASHFDLRKIVLSGVAEEFVDAVEPYDLLSSLGDLP